MKKSNWIMLVCGIALAGMVGTTASMAAGAVSTEIVTKELSRLAAPATEKLLQDAVSNNGVSADLKAALFGNTEVAVNSTTLKLALMGALKAPKSEAQQKAALAFLSGLQSSAKTVSVAAAANMGSTAALTKNRFASTQTIDPSSSVDADEETIKAIENRVKVIGDLDESVAKDAVAVLAEKGTISGQGMIACQGKVEGKESGFPAESANNALKIAVLAKKLGNGCKGLYAAASQTLGISMSEATSRVSTLIGKCQIFGGEYAACAQ